MKKTNIKLFLISLPLIIIALVMSYSLFGFTSVAFAQGDCNPTPTGLPNLFMFTGDSPDADVQPLAIRTQDGLIINECRSSLYEPTFITSGIENKPYPDWSWAYEGTHASLGYANLNTTPGATTNCAYGQPGCSVIQTVAAHGFGKLYSPTGTDFGFYAKCLSYNAIPNDDNSIKYLVLDSQDNWVDMEDSEANLVANCANNGSKTIISSDLLY